MKNIIKWLFIGAIGWFVWPLFTPKDKKEVSASNSAAPASLLPYQITKAEPNPPFYVMVDVDIPQKYPKSDLENLAKAIEKETKAAKNLPANIRFMTPISRINSGGVAGYKNGVVDIIYLTLEEEVKLLTEARKVFKSGWYCDHIKSMACVYSLEGDNLSVLYPDLSKGSDKIIFVDKGKRIFKKWKDATDRYKIEDNGSIVIYNGSGKPVETWLPLK